jgi:signal transduction histidine kinase
MVNGSSEKLARVAENLLDNAIKFSPRGSDIEVGMSTTRKYVVISFTDKGIGIPAEMLSELFDMLTPAKRPGTEGEKSYGLGLAICKQLVEAHGGTIGASSVAGAGTTLTVLLPLIS